jgi:hypothetical protein
MTGGLDEIVLNGALAWCEQLEHAVEWQRQVTGGGKQGLMTG